MVEKQSILALYGFGWKPGRIARETGHGHRAVLRLIRELAKCTSEVPTGSTALAQ